MDVDAASHLSLGTWTLRLAFYTTSHVFRDSMTSEWRIAVSYCFYLKSDFFSLLSLFPSGLYLKTIDRVTFKGHNILPINLTSSFFFTFCFVFVSSRSNHDHQRNVFFLSSREQESHSFNLKGQFSIINLATVNAAIISSGDRTHTHCWYENARSQTTRRVASVNRADIQNVYFSPS